MKQLRQLLTIALIALGVNAAWAQTYVVGDVATEVTTWSNVQPGKWYKFMHANQDETNGVEITLGTTTKHLKDCFMTANAENVYGTFESFDANGVWTLVNVGTDDAPQYKIKNLNGKYLRYKGTRTAGNLTKYMVGPTENPDDAMVFTLSLGNADNLNCLFTAVTPPTTGCKWLHFDTGFTLSEETTRIGQECFFHDLQGVNSQFRLHEVDVKEFHSVTYYMEGSTTPTTDVGYYFKITSGSMQGTPDFTRPAGITDNQIEAGTSPIFYDKRSYQVLNLVKITDGTNEYTSWDGLTKGKTLSVYLRKRQYIDPNKRYVLRHAQAGQSEPNTVRYMKLDGSYIRAEENADGDRTTDTKFMFKFVDLGDGRYNIKTVYDEHYVNRPGVTCGQWSVTESNNKFYVSDAMLTEGMDGYGAFALMDAYQAGLPNPIVASNNTLPANEYFLHNNNGNAIVKWRNNAYENQRSMWYIEEVLPKAHRLTFVDEDGNPLTGVHYSPKDNNLDASEIDINTASVTFTDKHYQVMNLLQVKVTTMGTSYGDTYTDWGSFYNAHNNVSLDITVTLEPARTIDPNKWYTIKNVGSNPNRYLNVGTSADLLRADPEGTAMEPTSVYWQFSEVDGGKYNIKTMYQNRLMSFADMDKSQQLKIHQTGNAQDDKYKFYVTNACDAEHPEYWSFAAATLVDDPTTAASMAQRAYIYNDGLGGTWFSDGEYRTNGPYTTRRWINNTAEKYALWTIEDANIHKVTLKFKRLRWNQETASWVEDTDLDGSIINTVGNSPKMTETVTVNGENVTIYKVYNCMNALTFNDRYYVVRRELNGTMYTSSSAFFTALRAITADTEVTLYVSQYGEAGEKDVTLDIFLDLGYFCNAAGGDAVYGNGADHPQDDRLGGTANTNWRLKQRSGTQLSNLNFEISSDVSKTSYKQPINNGVKYLYYSTEADDKRCLCFKIPDAGEEVKYNLNVSSTDDEKYYILQYELGLQQQDDNLNFIVANEGNATATSQTRDHRNVVTDTPCAASTSFTLTRNGGTGPYSNAAATFFRVRIVNEAYLNATKENGKDICQAALDKATATDNEDNVVGTVGYPSPVYTTTGGTSGLKGPEAIDGLRTAIIKFNGDDDLANYANMLQAYSKFISCRDLKLPEDCKVYNLYIMDGERGRSLLGVDNNDALVVQPATADPTDKSNRWITHKDSDGKMVFVNKADGKYLQLDADGPVLADLYDEDKAAIEIAPINQDVSDYMESATDENLLGAVYLRTPSAALTLNYTDNTWHNEEHAHFDAEWTSALSIEEVTGGETYTSITLNPVDGIYWGSYVSYFPIQVPTNAEAYYVTNVHDGWFHLEQIESDVILPNFPVIIRSEGNKSLYEELSGTASEHLHIGLLTDEVYNGDGTEANPGIKGRILAKGRNLLQGKARADVLHADVRQLDQNNVDGDDELRYALINSTSKDGFVYVLNKGSRGVGFYRLDDSVEEIPAGKAYYVHPEKLSNGQPNNIRGFIFTDDKGVETRVEFDNADSDATIYDLSGRRIDTAKGGVYIINGKKVVNKK